MCGESDAQNPKPEKKHKGSKGRRGPRRKAARSGRPGAKRTLEGEVLGLFIAVYKHFELRNLPPDPPRHEDDSAAEDSGPYVPPLRPLPSAIGQFLYEASRDHLYSALLDVLSGLEKLEKEGREETG